MRKRKNRNSQDGLTDKQEAFVQEYIIDFCGSHAAIRAGYSEKTATEQSSVLLKNPKIQAAIKKAMDARSDRTQITQDRVLQEFARIAFFDPRKLFHPDGRPKLINELDHDTAASVAGLDVSEQFEGSGDERQFVGHVKKYKLADKKGALDSVARHLGMFNDKLDINATVKNLTDDQLNAKLTELLRKAAAS